MKVGRKPEYPEETPVARDKRSVCCTLFVHDCALATAA